MPEFGCIGEDITTNEKLKISCFGKLTLSMGNSYLLLKNKKAKELIAFLVCAKGKPVKKTRLAETLWPEIPMENAMSSLYKVLRYIREFGNQDFNIPVVESMGQVCLDMTCIICDLTEFERMYCEKNNIESCIAMEEIYSAPLFFDEFYEWVAPFEAYYDIRYAEIIEILISHFTEMGDQVKAGYYSTKLN